MYNTDHFCLPFRRRLNYVRDMEFSRISRFCTAGAVVAALWLVLAPRRDIGIIDDQIQASALKTPPALAAPPLDSACPPDDALISETDFIPHISFHFSVFEVHGGLAWRLNNPSTAPPSGHQRLESVGIHAALRLLFRNRNGQPSS